MQHIIKYENLTDLVPKLQKVLVDSIQDDCLEIRQVNTASDKFLSTLERYPALSDAEYVVYSKFIKKCEHQHETFIFLDTEGKTLAHISGRDLALYGIIKPCEEFAVTQEYAHNAAS